MAKKTTKWWHSEWAIMLLPFLMFFGWFGIIGLIALPSAERCVAQMEKNIEKMNFIKARKYLTYYYERSESSLGGVSKSSYYEYRDKICRAQVIALMMEGNFDVAIQIANEDGNSDYYEDIYLTHIQALYEKLSLSQFLVGLSKIPYKSNEDDIKEYNATIEQLCVLLHATGRSQEINALLYHLREYTGEDSRAIQRVKQQTKAIRQRFSNHNSKY